MSIPLVQNLIMIRLTLLDHLDELLQANFPDGTFSSTGDNPETFRMGSAAGETGKSFAVRLTDTDNSRGTFFDFADDTEQTRGDIIDLYALMLGKSLDFEKKVRPWFNEVLEVASATFSIPKVTPEELKRLEAEQPVITPSSLSPDQLATKNWQVLAGSHKGEEKRTDYFYIDADGVALFAVTRIDHERLSDKAKPTKSIFQHSYQSADGKVAGLPKVLYNLMAILDAKKANIKETKVYLVEGEKSAQTLIEHGYLATTVMGGSSLKILGETDLTPLRDLQIIIVPDNDAKGRTFMTSFFKVLQAMGVKSVETILIEPIPVSEEEQLIEKNRTNIRKIINPVKPTGWDVADGVAEENFDLAIFLRSAKRDAEKTWVPYKPQGENRGDFLKNKSSDAFEILEGGFLPSGETLLLAGAPKIGKSNFILAMAQYLATGQPFLNIVPKRPLNIFYYQTELQQNFLAERVEKLHSPIDDTDDPEEKARLLQLMDKNLSLTERNKMASLTDQHIDDLVELLIDCYGSEPLDVLILDPLRDIFSMTNADADENNNSNMMNFLNNHMEVLRRRIGLKCGIMIVHHTNKGTRTLKDGEIMNAIAGAGALRGYSATNMVMYEAKADSEESEFLAELAQGASVIKLETETRYGEPLPTQYLKFEEGKYTLLDDVPGQIETQRQEHEERSEADENQQIAEDSAQYADDKLIARAAILKEVPVQALKGILFNKSALTNRMVDLQIFPRGRRNTKDTWSGHIDRLAFDDDGFVLITSVDILRSIGFSKAANCYGYYTVNGMRFLCSDGREVALSGTSAKEITPA